MVTEGQGRGKPVVALGRALSSKSCPARDFSQTGLLSNEPAGLAGVRIVQVCQKCLIDKINRCIDWVDGQAWA